MSKRGKIKAKDLIGTVIFLGGIAVEGKRGYAPAIELTGKPRVGGADCLLVCVRPVKEVIGSVGN